ncbi:MAG: TldD/PmbA family protein [Halanaerobium sp.]|nr:TldD/PmbA family protein [Halanaerobium sp.]
MDNLRLCQQLVDKGLEMGADSIEVFHLGSREIEVVWEKNDFQVPKTDDYKGVGIRVIKEGSVGFASTNVLEESELAAALERALAIAAVTPADPHNVLPEREELSYVPGLVDKENKEISLPKAIRVGQAFVESYHNYDPRCSLDSASFKVSITRRALANSNGITAREEKTTYENMAVGFARDGERVSSFDVSILNDCKLSQLDLKSEAEELARKVANSLDAETIPSFTGSVILAPYPALTLVAMPLSFSVNAENVLNGITRWREPGTKVAADILQVTDNALLPGAVGSRSFDREGVPGREVVLIKDGILQGFLHNSYTAHKMEAQTTGHAGGNDQGQPVISPSNFIIEPGEDTLEEIKRRVKKGIIVNRFSGNLDPVSGDFSGVVKGGEYIEDGRIVKPVKEIMIAGNMYKLLKEIKALSSEYKNIGGNQLPYILLDGVSITGK